MTSPLEPTTCPLCGTVFDMLPRYHGILCRDCADRATDADGRRLRLTNTSLSGGFAAWYADRDRELCEEVSVTHVVYVDGVRCRADEGRFGGIVVRPETETAPETGPETGPGPKPGGVS
ncbi:MAG TPA: hypothetical protein VLA97_16670 [Nocardioidaceae bacterium]|nr:hypothetical protein [Nocardioidaceae bacterium]